MYLAYALQVIFFYSWISAISHQPRCTDIRLTDQYYGTWRCWAFCFRLCRRSLGLVQFAVEESPTFGTSHLLGPSAVLLLAAWGFHLSLQHPLWRAFRSAWDPRDLRTAMASLDVCCFSFATRFLQNLKWFVWLIDSWIIILTTLTHQYTHTAGWKWSEVQTVGKSHGHFGLGSAEDVVESHRCDRISWVHRCMWRWVAMHETCWSLRSRKIPRPGKRISAQGWQWQVPCTWM